DELYRAAVSLLRSLKISKKKLPTSNEFGEEPSIPLFLYRSLDRLIFSLSGIHLPITDNLDIGKQSNARIKNPKLIKAVEFLEKAAFDYAHDDALFTLGEMNFLAKYSHPRNLTAAFHYYRELANRSGNATAQQMIGFMYATGIGNVVERDQGKALLYHTFAALGHDTAAEMTLAYRHFTGIGVPRSCENAVLHYKRVADKAIKHYRSGPPGGRQLPLYKIKLYDEDGGIYGYGASGTGSSSKPGDQAALEDILEYYRYSADRGDMTSQLVLGQLYYQGTRNIPQNFPLALRYLQQVASQYWKSDNTVVDPSSNSKLAQAAGQAAGILGQMYLRGEGVKQNNQTAKKWFARGAQLHNPASYNGLGLMYLEGIEFQQSPEKAIEFFKSAAEAEYPDAQVNLGLMYYQKKDTQIAFNYFHKAANSAQHLLACYYLAEMYAEGLGVEQSCAMAAAFYKNVAERGDWSHSPFSSAHAAYAAGDRDGALIYYLMGAERGYEVGQSNVAWLLDKDKSWWHLPQLVSSSDISREKLALLYWTRSANQGNVDARVKMGDYYFKGFGTEVDYEKAAACYQVAAEANLNSMAMWNLGWMHENGIGVVKDFHLAKRWYDQSLSNNPDSYLPVTLSLINLNVKRIWNYLIGVDVGNDDKVSDGWWNDSPFDGEGDETGGSIEQVQAISNEGSNSKDS
ncbi:11666_t:CDS:10, partial [Acaulospora morrowiae]